MSDDIDSLTDNFDKLSLSNIVKIQRLYRGYRVRKRRLPLVLYKVQKYLTDNPIKLSVNNSDGRVNSSTDEQIIISALDKFKIKKAPMRMWYDIAIYDNLHGWIPVNIKTTSMMSADNTGNLAMCAYTYTDIDMSIDNTYNNSKIYTDLIDRLKNKKYNFSNRDYYFIVINKNNTKDVIINSLKGATILTPNINNLPFQICWNKNREYVYKHIQISVQIFVECIKKYSVSWKENFVNGIKSL